VLFRIVCSVSDWDGVIGRVSDVNLRQLLVILSKLPIRLPKWRNYIEAWWNVAFFFFIEHNSYRFNRLHNELISNRGYSCYRDYLFANPQ
jgi:hypothetical protein